MIELLAPAGSMENLRTAIASGADAIYLAGKMFGARAYAANFSEEEMRAAVEYAHLRNVKINVTVNTLVDETEIPALEKYLLFLDEIGVDAILVQDLGVANLARKIVPNLSLHASTQMTVNTLAGVQALGELGFTRVVLAREVTLEDIKYICNNTDLEIEIFAHGAICVCYSGQCLMSSMIGGRSGNRGRCAQPCRLPYTLENSKGEVVLDEAGDFLLSPKDMNTLDLVPELIKIGVSSLKLEGRMKSPEYVSIAVNTYRQKIDEFYYGYDVDKDLGKNLSETFNREFTTAYLERKPGKFMMADNRPNNRGYYIGDIISFNKKQKYIEIKVHDELYKGDVLVCGDNIKDNTINIDKDFPLKSSNTQVIKVKYDKLELKGKKVYRVYNANLMGNIKGFVQKPEEYIKFPIDFIIRAKVGQELVLEGRDGEFSSIIYTDFIVPKAEKRAADYDYLEKQLSRLGNTIFYLNKLDLDIDLDVMIPASIINESRRLVVEELYIKRLKNYSRKIVNKTFNHINITDVNKYDFTKLVVHVDDEEKLKRAVEAGADIVIYGGDNYQHRQVSLEEVKRVLSYCKLKNCKLYLGTSRIIREADWSSFKNWINCIKDLDIDGIYAHSLAQMSILRKKTNFDIWSDYSFNIWNEACLRFLKDYGIKGATLSPELTLKKDKMLAESNILPLECIVHGRTELMVSEYCVLGSFLGDLDKGKCTMPCVKDKYYLRDRKNELIQVGTDVNCHMHLLNGKILNMLAYVPEFTKNKFDRIRIDCRSFNSKQVKDIVKIYKEVLLQGKEHKIFLNKSIEKYEQNITRGHYFRGVE